MNGTKEAMIYAIEDGKKYRDEKSKKRKKRQVYKVLITDVLDDNGACSIAEMYEKKGSGWLEIDCGGYVLSRDDEDVFAFFNKHAIGLESEVGDWSDVLDKDFLILL